MRMRPFIAISLILLVLSAGCAPASNPQPPYKPGFFYLPSSQAANPAIVIFDQPGGPARKTIALNPPADCSLFALRPAPLGRWIAVEWECSFGPAVELFDTATGESHFPLSNPTIDSRFLAWQPDGSSIYLKIGTLSIPQTLRVEAASVKAIELPISPFVYDLTASPDGKRVLYSLTKGIGFGSETWLAGPDGQNASQLLVDATHITALAHYSPDGSQIAYISFPDSQNSTPPGELWLMDADGFKPHKLADADAGRGFYPAWSPEGSRIAFIGRASPDKPDALNLSIYDLTQNKLITTPATPGTQPAWSPDGASVAFSDNALINSGGDTINVWFYNISSGQVNKLVSGACCAGWIR